MSRNLPSRVSVRLSGFDYSSSNWYYVTICTHEREYLFGKIIDSVGARPASPAYTMELNNAGKIIQSTWELLPSHHNIKLDAFQIMPNHVHGVITINKTGEAGLAPTQTLGSIIGSFKSKCTKEIRISLNNPSMIVWQRNYYEHIIRDDGELTHIRKYIKDNPKNWITDKLYVGARPASPVPNVGARPASPVISKI